MANESIIQLRGIEKRFGEFQAVRQLDLDIAEGEFLTLLGASGSGKTTTLRMIAGFERPTAGEIVMDGVVINELPPFRRDVNTVFQSYALFPHMNIWRNVAYGLQVKGTAKAETQERVGAALRMVQLEPLAARMPRQLSGGQQQRVALARALVNRPRVLLLDEPLGALDLKLRREMQIELKHIQQALGITFVYVTHDQEEALTMSNRIALMHNGAIEQLSSPEEIYAQPRTRYVAGFIGETNLFAAPVRATEADGVAVLDLAGTAIRGQSAAPVAAGSTVHVSVRPEAVRVLDGEAASAGANCTTGTLRERIYAGAVTKLRVAITPEIDLTVHHADGAVLAAPGTLLRLAWPVEHTRILVE